MPEFHDLWISGGEPFLRADLAKVIELFYVNNRVRDVRIPTNGLPTAQTARIVKEILLSCPELHLEVDMSLDGFSETHNRIRGVEGNFEKALTTFAELQAIRTECPNLSLYINSVITRENQDEVVGLGDYFARNNQPDGHYFQIIRGDPKDPTLQKVASQKLKQIYQEVLPINLHYLSKTSKDSSRLDWIRKAYWKAGYAFSYRTQYDNYAKGAKWKMPCSAGQTSIVIDYNGDVRVCELRKPIGNLRKYGMNFKDFWNSVERRLEVRKVKLDQCFCTHICFMYDSMRHSKRVMLWELPLTSLKLWLRGIRSPRSKPELAYTLDREIPPLATPLPTNEIP